MAEGRQECGQDEGMVADIRDQTPRTLPVLRSQRQYACTQAILGTYITAGLEKHDI